MSFFKATWIILKIDRYDKYELLHIFTNEYGKICVKKTKKTKNLLDLWYIISFEINVKNQNKIHPISQISIKKSLNYQNLSSDIIIIFLENLNIIYKLIPEKIPQKQIYESFLLILEKENIKKDIFIIQKLVFLKYLWLLWENTQNITLLKIINFINNSSLKEAFKLSIKDDLILNQINQYILENTK